SRAGARLPGAGDTSRLILALRGSPCDTRGAPGTGAAALVQARSRSPEPGRARGRGRGHGAALQRDLGVLRVPQRPVCRPARPACPAARGGTGMTGWVLDAALAAAALMVAGELG